MPRSLHIQLMTGGLALEEISVKTIAKTIVRTVAKIIVLTKTMDEVSLIAATIEDVAEVALSRVWMMVRGNFVILTIILVGVDLSVL